MSLSHVINIPPGHGPLRLKSLRIIPRLLCRCPSMIHDASCRINSQALHKGGKCLTILSLFRMPMIHVEEFFLKQSVIQIVYMTCL